jgi:acyl dehydratase
MRYADLQPGQIITAGPRLVTAEEIVEFARRYDPQPFHVDADFAKASRWQGLIASGWMTCAIAMQLVVEAALRGSESIGSPGVEQVKWAAPVRAGDQLSLRIEVLEKRLSRSGSVGIIRWRWTLTTQADVMVLDLIGTSFFEVRPSTATGR